MKIRNVILKMRVLPLVVAGASLYFGLSGAVSQASRTAADIPSGAAEATINLATTDGVKLVKGDWRYSDTKIVEVDFRRAGADNQPTGAPVRPMTTHRMLEALTLTTPSGKRSARRLSISVAVRADWVSTGIASS